MKTKAASAKIIHPAKPAPELKTEPPLSEKDEVKKAENRTIKASKKHL